MMPDHSITVTEIKFGETNDYVPEDVCPNREQANTSCKKYNFETCQLILWNLMHGMNPLVIVYMKLIKTTSQQEINGIYEYFYNTLYSEME